MAAPAPSAAEFLRAAPADLLHHVIIPLLGNPAPGSEAAMRAWDDKFLDWYTANRQRTCAQCADPLPLPTQWAARDSHLHQMSDLALVKLFLLVQPEPLDFNVWHWLLGSSKESRVESMVRWVNCKTDWAVIRDQERYQDSVIAHSERGDIVDSDGEDEDED